MNQEFLTVEEVAQLLKTPAYTVREWARTRRLPAFRIGRRWLFDKDEVISAVHATLR